MSASPPPLRVLISAAEPSGDRLAAEVIEALRIHPQVRALGHLQVRGLAGPAMRAAGVAVVSRVEDVSVMGIIEVLRHLRRVTRARAAMQQAVDAGADVLVVVDAPDLHLPLATRAKARGIAVVGIVSPQIWAWRRSRTHKIAANMDRLCCLFAFEPQVYADTLGPVPPAQTPTFCPVWTGHPVVDRLPPRDPDQIDPSLYALLPGSRRQELARHLTLFLDTAARVRQRQPDARFLLPGWSPTSTPPPDLPSWIQPVDSVAELSRCRAALTKSGTVTLELAVLGVPMVVAHRVHPLTWLLGRLLVRQVHHVAMPNVLADQAAGAKTTPVVPEFLQHLDPEKLADALLALPDHQPIDLSALGPPGPPGAAARAAAQIAAQLVDVQRAHATE